MRGPRTLGLCLVAVFATTALDSASATAAEYGHCVLLAKAKGHYADANCQLAPKKAGKGAYEWEDGPGNCLYVAKHGGYSDPACTVPDMKKGKPKGTYERAACSPNCGKFTSSSTGVTFGEAPALGAGPLACQSYSDTGEVAGPGGGTARLTYTNCLAASLGICTTPGQAPGTIQTPELDTVLVEPTAGHVLTRFISKTGSSGYSYEFECGGYKFSVAGLVAGVTSGNINVMSGTSKNEFALGIGEQGLETYVAGHGGPYASLYEAAITTTFTSSTEIKT